MKMKFGSDETFALIETALNQEGTEAYEPIWEIIYQDLGLLIGKHCHDITEDIREEIRQELALSIREKLLWIYRKTVDKSERERNAYLVTIVENRRKDYKRIQRKTLGDESLDSEDAPVVPCGRDFTRQVLNRFEIFDALKHVFELKSSPDRLLAFVYNCMLANLDGFNGSPREIIEDFDGKPVRFMIDKMVEDLELLLNTEVPPDVLEPLESKMADYSENYVFNCTVRQITDSSSEIRKKMKEMKKND